MAEKRADGSYLLAGLSAPPVIGHRVTKSVLALLDRMHRDTLKECRAIFEADMGLPKEGGAQDASVASQARIRINALQTKWRAAFGRLGVMLAEKMVSDVAKSSAVAINGSLRSVAEGLEIDTSYQDARLKEVIKASTQWAADKIKRIPERYLAAVADETAKSITSGRGMADLVPQLTARYKGDARWAQHVAMDQTRKAQAHIGHAQLAKAGVKSFVWIHTGGGHPDRNLHKYKLNGKEFEFSDPPIIVEATATRPAERGLPGDAIFCRCIAKPVFRFPGSTSAPAPASSAPKQKP
ncbi:MAG: phage minor head protein [Limnohabitans sp.]